MKRIILPLLIVASLFSFQAWATPAPSPSNDELEALKARVDALEKEKSQKDSDQDQKLDDVEARINKFDQNI